MVAILNGELSAALLATVPWDTAEHLRPGALADLIRLNAAFRARFGHNLIINESYRDLPTQKRYYKSPPSGVGTAAWPGTSNHGWGLAVDLHLTAEESAWMRANAPAYGWVNPAWAHDGRGSEEPWHWEHATAGSVIPDTITPAPAQEDDMYTDQDRATSTAMYKWLQQMQPLVVTHTAAIAVDAHGAHASADLTLAAAGNITNGVLGIMAQIRALPATALGDVDEAALAAALAPLLTSPALADADLARVAKAVADEQARRLVS